MDPDAGKAKPKQHPGCSHIARRTNKPVIMEEASEWPEVSVLSSPAPKCSA